jgi:hypothetical protein
VDWDRFGLTLGRFPAMVGAVRLPTTAGGSARAERPPRLQLSATRRLGGARPMHKTLSGWLRRCRCDGISSERSGKVSLAAAEHWQRSGQGHTTLGSFCCERGGEKGVWRPRGCPGHAVDQLAWRQDDMRARCRRQRIAARGGMHGGGRPMWPLGAAYTGQGCAVNPKHESGGCNGVYTRALGGRRVLRERHHARPARERDAPVVPVVFNSIY